MQLHLQNGYPFPLPQDFDSDEYDCRDFTAELSGVVHFEWKHTLTIQFATYEDFATARAITDWKVWSDEQFTLEASYSTSSGYDCPAIVIKDIAYCGFILLGDSA